MRLPTSRRSILLVAAAIGCATRPAPHAPPVLAPQPPAALRTLGSLAPGERIRWSAEASGPRFRTDRFRRAAADTLWVASGRPVPLAGIARIEVSLGGRPPERQLMLGALWGAGVGAALLALVRPDPESTTAMHSTGERAMLGALVGIPVGLTVGALLPGERWERLALRP